MNPHKWRCQHCGVIGPQEEIITNVTDPEPLPDTVANTWTVCRVCREVDGFDNLCQAPGCERIAGSGRNTRHLEYVWTCWDHRDLGQTICEAPSKL